MSDRAGRTVDPSERNRHDGAASLTTPIVLGGAGRLDRRAWPQRSPKYNTSFRRVAETRRIHDAVRRRCEGGGRDPSTIVWSAGQVSGGGCHERHRRAPRIQNPIAEGTKRHAKAPALGLRWDSVEVRMGSSSRSGRVVSTPNSSPRPGRRAIVIAMGSASLRRRTSKIDAVAGIATPSCPRCQGFRKVPATVKS